MNDYSDKKNDSEALEYDFSRRNNDLKRVKTIFFQVSLPDTGEKDGKIEDGMDNSLFFHNFQMIAH